MVAGIHKKIAISVPLMDGQTLEEMVKHNREALQAAAGRLQFPYTGLVVPVRPNTLPVVGPLNISPDTILYAINPSTRKVNGDDVLLYEYTPTISPSMNGMLTAMAEAMAYLKSFNPRAQHTTKAIDEMVDAFLEGHGLPPYKTFVNSIPVAGITENDYSSIAKASLKKSLFNYRAMVYLTALAAAEKQGHPLKALLQELGSAVIYPIKKEVAEPTFAILKERLTSRASS